MMKKTLKELDQQIGSLALSAVMLEAGDIPALGAILNTLESLENLSKGLKKEFVTLIIRAMKGYIEKVILCERSELNPFEAAISQLQEMCRNLINGKGFEKDISSLLKSLDFENFATLKSSDTDDILSSGPDRDAITPDAADLTHDENRKEESERTRVGLNGEDREIIADFVAESLENLGTIEIRVMDLEQDPSDTETINAIFRPFHTVKGVSGFLNFNRINKLAHVVENLLDKARNRELEIDAEIIDVILDSVDLLTRMIENVQNTLNTGVPEEGDLDIEQHIVRVEYYVARKGRSKKKSLGEILVEKGAISEGDLEAALDLQEKQKEKKLGEILLEEKKVEASDVVCALREQKQTSQAVTLQVKIDTEKLDNIVDMVGELAIAQSMLRQNEVIINDSSRKLDHIINQLNLITSGLQKTTMTLRMVPIKHTFQKMLRLVRDLAKKAGKEVQLVMAGEDTEIDRNMVEEIYEPMVHIIRNSVDHGMELPQERLSANKPERGTIYLKAYHKGGDIVIEIGDDGRGLNREKILEKALSRGLIREGEKLTESEINNFIFHPGFSTAEKITDISGRGVGMDVVKSKIVERLRGRVEIQSAPGKGTTILIRLPLTLAILDGMIVKIDGEKYIIPTLMVQESFKPKKSEYHTVQGEGEMIKIRNRLLPLIRLDRILSLNGNGSSNERDKAPWERLAVVVENQEKKWCLLIDELLGQEEVVIKSLGEMFKGVKGIAGGAIMGDGKVSLILDIAGIFELTSEAL